MSGDDPGARVEPDTVVAQVRDECLPQPPERARRGGGIEPLHYFGGAGEASEQVDGTRAPDRCLADSAAAVRVRESRCVLAPGTEPEDSRRSRSGSEQRKESDGHIRLDPRRWRRRLVLASGGGRTA